MRWWQCKQCHELVEDQMEVCGRCGRLRGTKLKETGPVVHSFRSGVYEHIAEEPIYIKNRKQLVDECNARGVRSWQMN